MAENILANPGGDQTKKKLASGRPRRLKDPPTGFGRWFDRAGMTVDEFLELFRVTAKQMGIDATLGKSYVYDLRNGEKEPSFRVMRVCHRISNGELGLEEWVAEIPSRG